MTSTRGSTCRKRRSASTAISCRFFAGRNRSGRRGRSCGGRGYGRGGGVEFECLSGSDGGRRIDRVKRGERGRERERERKRKSKTHRQRPPPPAYSSPPPPPAPPLPHPSPHTPTHSNAMPGEAPRRELQQIWQKSSSSWLPLRLSTHSRTRHGQHRGLSTSASPRTP